MSAKRSGVRGVWLGALVAGMAVSVSAWGAGASLPVKSVTLYRSGVAYVERAGRVDGEAEVSLRFEKEQVNDILKSLVALDGGGGTVRAVRYGSKDPLARRLGSFGIDISTNPSVVELLQQLRGARVRVATTEGPIDGTVLGTEQRQVGVSGSNARGEGVIWESYVSVLTGSGVRTIGVQRITSFEVMDEKLAEELRLALGAVAESRDERSATVDLSFSGNGARDVAIGYVVESPVWKTSYRLVLPEGTGGKTTLQGWAIVENTTDEDWEGVRLALASGNPVGFRMDLHEPLFVARPLIPVPTAMAVRGRVYEDALGMSTDRAAGKAGSAPAAAPEMAAMSRARRMLDASGEMRNSESDMGRYLSQGVDTSTEGMASASERGEAFRYEIGAPVTIERQRSAMLPVMNGGIEAERVSIYSPGDNSQHPMRGVELTNSSGFELAPGPISVLDGSGYLGDAQIGFTSRGQKRLLAYAVDMDVRATMESDAREDVVRLKISNGTVMQESKSRLTTKYAFTNRDGREGRTVLVEQEKREGWEVTSPKEWRSESEGLRRFEVKLGAAEQEKLEVVEERTNWTRLGVTSVDLPTVLGYAKNGKASQAVVDAVRKAGEIQGRVNEAEAQARRVQVEMDGIASDQSRVRQNMGAIDRASELYARYMRTLNEQETRMEALRKESAEAVNRAAQARGELARYLEGLNVE
ncbi:MAG: DUF4139 domain-containing protein [Phycisphaerales bacterium]